MGCNARFSYPVQQQEADCKYVGSGSRLIIDSHRIVLGIFAVLLVTPDCSTEHAVTFYVAN